MQEVIKLKTGVIYCIENKVNGKKYIGMTTNPPQRWKTHQKLLNKNKHHNIHLQNSWNKYGKKEFNFKIIERNIDQKELSDKEIYWIKFYNTFNGKGYNLTEGGEGLNGYSFPEETKNKISKSLQGHKCSKETKSKISEALTGFKHPDEFRKKLSEARKGIKLSEKHKINISKGKTGHDVSKKTKSKISKSLNKNITKEVGNKIYKEYHNSDKFQKYFAKKYKISLYTINKIINCKHWSTKSKKYNKKDNRMKGSNHIKSKLNKKKSLKIIKEYKETNITLKELAKKYNVGKTTIGNVICLKHWSTRDLERGK